MTLSVGSQSAIERQGTAPGENDLEPRTQYMIASPQLDGTGALRGSPVR